MAVLGLAGGSLRAVLLVCAVMATSLSSGCLFPPVATPVEFDGPTTPIEGENRNETPVYEQQFFLETREGNVEAGLRLQDMEHGVVQHVFDLDPRLAVVRVFLEWNHTVYDLDLAAELSEGPDRDPLWVAKDTQGGPGEPDAPVILEVNDRSKIFLETPTQLRVTVSTDASAEVSYTVTARGTYLVPQG